MKMMRGGECVWRVRRHVNKEREEKGMRERDGERERHSRGKCCIKDRTVKGSERENKRQLTRGNTKSATLCLHLDL